MAIWPWLRALFGGRASQPPREAICRAKLARLPSALIAIDTETTGLHSRDRIVSLAALRVETADLAGGQFHLQSIHLVFNPEKKSHPKAAAVHGYSDRLLAYQEPFSAYAGLLQEFLGSGDMIVAHNVAFDLPFINREMAHASMPPVKRPCYCTMQGYRALGLGGSASLNAVCSHIGLVRHEEFHNALEDAWLALLLYLWLHDCPQSASLPGDVLAPTNLRQP